MRDAVAIRKLEKSCEDVSQILRALGHPQRLMVMAHLSDGEKNVSELVDLCDVSQSQLSQFLGRMKAEGLVDSRREGAYQYYFIEDKRVAKLIKTLADLFCK